jgi:leukocyte cell-derived chemotaxin-2
MGTSWKILYTDVDPSIKIGDKINAGQVMGTAQDITGTYPGIKNHVHVKLRINYQVVDPAKYIPPP